MRQCHHQLTPAPQAKVKPRGKRPRRTAAGATASRPRPCAPNHQAEQNWSLGCKPLHMTRPHQLHVVEIHDGPDCNVRVRHPLEGIPHCCGGLLPSPPSHTTSEARRRPKISRRRRHAVVILPSEKRHHRSARWVGQPPPTPPPSSTHHNAHVASTLSVESATPVRPPARLSL